MHIYKLSVDRYGYDQYDAVVVAADDEPDAIAIAQLEVGYNPGTQTWDLHREWGDPRVELVGDTPHEPGVILASYNAS